MPAKIGFLSENNLYAPVLRSELQELIASLQANLNPLGVWVAVSDPTAFSGNGLMTWTVETRDQVDLSYKIDGATMTVNLKVDATTVAGTVNTTLRMLIPAAKTATRTMTAPCQIFDNSAATSVLGQLKATANSRFLEISRFDSANFTASTNLTYIRGQIAFEVN